MLPVATTLSISANSKSSFAISSKKCGIANSYSLSRTFSRMTSMIASAYLPLFIVEQQLRQLEVCPCGIFLGRIPVVAQGRLAEQKAVECAVVGLLVEKPCEVVNLALKILSKLATSFSISS